MDDKPMGVVPFYRFVDQFPCIFKFVYRKTVEDLIIIGIKLIVMGFAEFRLGVEMAKMKKMAVDIESWFCERKWDCFEA